MKVFVVSGQGSVVRKKAKTSKDVRRGISLATIGARLVRVSSERIYW